MTEAAFGRFTYNQYEGTSILAGGRKVEVLLPPVTLSLGVVQNRKNEWLEVEVLQYKFTRWVVGMGGDGEWDHFDQLLLFSSHSNL